MAPNAAKNTRSAAYLCHDDGGASPTPSTESTTSRSKRRISFHEDLTTNVVEIPTLTPEMKSVLFYDKQDYVAFYKDQRQSEMENIHALVKDIMKDEIDEAIAKGASREEIEAKLPQTPDQVYKFLFAKQNAGGNAPAPPSLFSDSDSDTSSSDDDDSSSSSDDDDDIESDDDSNDDDWEKPDIAKTKVCQPRRRSIDSDEKCEDNAYDWEQVEKTNEAKETKKTQTARRRSIDVSDDTTSADDFTDDDIYALFDVTDDSSSKKGEEKKSSSRDSFSTTKNHKAKRDSIDTTANDLSDDGIYALFGIDSEDAAVQEKVDRLALLSSPSKRGYRRSFNLYSPAPIGLRKRRVSQLPRAPKLGGRRCESFAKLLSRSKSQ